MQPEEEELERAEAEFQAEARAYLPRNYAAHLAHGLFGQTGFRLIRAPTFVPAYIYGLGGSELYVGLARAVESLGLCLTPLFGATRIEHRRRVLPLGLAVGWGARLQVLGIALAGFLLTDLFALFATVALFGLLGAFQGMQRVIFGFLRSKVIPLDVRGRLMGLRNFLAGLTAAAVAGFGGVLIERGALGNGYAATFLLAFAFTAVGLSLLSFMKEPPSPQVHERRDLAERLRDLPELLASDREFTIYFALRALAGMGRICLPYTTLYAAASLELRGSEAGAEFGVWTAAWSLAQTAANLVWGALADRSGFRAVFLASLAIWMSSIAGLFASSSFLHFTLVFAGIGAGMGGFQLSSQNLILEFGSRPNLPIRIGVANTASELVAAVGLAGGGWLAASVSYSAVFATALVCQLIAFLGVFRFVREPRTLGSS